MSKVTIAVNVFNHTDTDMVLEDAHLDHGKWYDRPESIGNSEEGDFEAGNGRSHCIDCHVHWRSERNHDDFTITIYKPEDGTARFAVDCSNGYRYTISGDPLERHARVSVSFYRQELK